MTHTLVLDRSYGLDDLFALTLNRYPLARKKKKTIRVSDTTSLVWNPSANEATIEVPMHRDGGPSEIPDGFGFDTAFPNGVPAGEEREILEFALNAVRRLGGKVVTDTGHELAPHQFMQPSLHVIAAYELAPKDLLEIVQKIVKESGLVGEPEGFPYMISAPIFAHADLVVEATTLEEDIPAIEHVEWVKEGAALYTVAYRPDDPSSLVAENPEKPQIREWREAYLGCSAVARAIWDETGGFVLDYENFLVNPNELF